MMRDAYYMPPTVEQVRKFAAAKGIPEMEAKLRIAAGRARFLTAMREDPYTHGYEPDIWLVVKALFRGIEPTRAQRERVRKILNLEWNDFAERMRWHLGFAKPVGEVLIMGANRSGKTDFASKLAMQLADSGGKSMLVGFQTLKTGKGTQMKRLWNYMPKPFKEKNIALKKASRIDEHISYTEQNGFAGSKITFGNRSILDFVTYEMDVKSIEGSEYDFGWLDEEFPQSFLSTLRSRLASKKGILLGTFTPISGYTPVVADFLDGMQVTKWHTAYMLPLDGGIVEPWSELGLAPEEYTALMDDSAEVPESRPEECLKWLLGEGEKGRADGRAFVRTPRVAVCKGGEAAAVWFYGSDNPYGSPGSVIRSAAKNRRATSEIKARVYGIAEKLSGRLFPKFSRDKNVIPLEALPKRLVRIHVVDPAPERNWCNGWYGYEKATDTLYKYREWPGNYEVPGVGVPPPWAQLSDRNHGVNDGEYAGGQEDFGMSFLKYKYEWARLERWKDFADWVKEGHDPLEWPENLDEVEEWTEFMGTEEPVAERVIDARAASQSKMSMKENLTLFDEVAKLAEGFLPASGQQIAVGLAVLRDRIEEGRYKVTANCTNTIFAYENYTGKDGQKGAVKDWIDCDRYAALSGIFEYDEEDATECGPGAAKQPSQRNFEDENDVPDDDFASWADD